MVVGPESLEAVQFPVIIGVGVLLPFGPGSSTIAAIERLNEGASLVLLADDEAEPFPVVIEVLLEEGGKAVVVCWIYDYLPDLAREFGLKPKPSPWKTSVYDRVWMMTCKDRTAVLTDQPQNLLPGDSTKLPLTRL